MDLSHYDAVVEKENVQNEPAKNATAAGLNKLSDVSASGPFDKNEQPCTSSRAVAPKKFAFRETTNVPFNNTISNAASAKKSKISDTKAERNQAKIARVEQLKKVKLIDANPEAAGAQKASEVVPKPIDNLSVEEKNILDTMDFTDIISPMSVDSVEPHIPIIDSIGSEKSLSLVEAHTEPTKKNAQMSCPAYDRKRFFDVMEYQADILQHFRESEKKRRPNADFMARQDNLDYGMRMILIDWMIEVGEEQHLDTETIYLSVSLIDRFLNEMPVDRSKFQLLATSALFIASKYEEVYHPAVRELVYLTDESYTREEVLQMERIILKILKFELITPTAYAFVNTYCVICNLPHKLKFLAQYLCELTLLMPDPYAKYYPSVVTAAAVAYAAYALGSVVWSPNLTRVTTYRLESLKTIILELNKTHNDALNWTQQAIQTKYDAIKYENVSKIQPLTLTADNLEVIVSAYEETEE